MIGLYLAYRLVLRKPGLAHWKTASPPVLARGIGASLVWVVVGGILGTRTAYMAVHGQNSFLREFFRIWDGGLVYYGSLVGGIVGFCLAYVFVLRRQNISFWKTADVLAPALTVGMCLGRIGCLLNGCCFGDVACTDCQVHGIAFPLPAAHNMPYTSVLGVETIAGFTMDDQDLTRRKVGRVAPHSPADEAGLRPGDVILEVNGRPMKSGAELDNFLGLGRDWERGQNRLQLKVDRNGQPQVVEYEPRTLPLYPTQLYESISMFLLFLLLTAFYPFRPRYGAVMVLFLLLYPIHRFLNEVLRNDTALVPHTGMTLSQNGSILIFLTAIVLAVVLWRHPPPEASAPAT
jgi:phosphatidylglycerol:prolipoprotein diacylglycerol transferase